jgi:recombination protein RecA
VSDTFSLKGSYSIIHGTTDTDPSADFDVSATFNESMNVKRKLAQTLSLDTDVAESVALGDLAQAHVVLIRSSQDVKVTLTSAHGASQVIPAGRVCFLMSVAVPIMAKSSTNQKVMGSTPDSDADKKHEAIKLAMDSIEKQYGRGSIMRFGEAAQKLDISVISTGCLPLDIALGVGGLPRGRIIEIYGPESSGKTTVCLSTIAQAQKHGGIAAFIDAEHALDPIWAERLGVKLDDLLISQPDTGEQALEITESLVRSGAVDVLVIDSVAALVPRAEIEGDMG